MRSFFNWAIEKGYILTNPFVHIKVKKKEKKKRTLIDSTTRKKISNYLNDNDKQFLIVLKLVYSALIRPKEIMNLRVADVNFKTKTMCVSGDVAKNHHTRYAALTDEILMDLEYIKDCKKDMFIFSQNMMPGYTQAHRAKYTKMWIKLRKELNLDQTMQLYSLRDTGFTEMLDANINAKKVQQHADHHSLEMTKIYTDHYDPNLVKAIRKDAPKF
jgi:integrase